MAAKILRLKQPVPPPVPMDLDPEEMIQDYLDHLLAPLVPIVPFRERDRLKNEAIFSIEQRMNQNLLRGHEPVEAALLAIEKYGQTEKLVENFLTEWEHYQPKGALGKLIGLPQSYAAIWFGQATLWTLLTLEYRLYFPPSEGAVTFGLTYADLRRLIPDPIPLPDGGIVTYLVYLLLLLTPFIAGWMIGRSAILHAARATYQVLALYTLGNFAIGIAMLPAREGLLLAFTQLFWWLPMGCLSAHVAAALAWRRRCAYHFIPFRRKL